MSIGHMALGKVLQSTVCSNIPWPGCCCPAEWTGHLLKCLQAAGWRGHRPSRLRQRHTCLPVRLQAERRSNSNSPVVVAAAVFAAKATTTRRDRSPVSRTQCSFGLFGLLATRSQVASVVLE